MQGSDGKSGEVRRVGQLRHPLPAPPREVRDQDVLTEVQLRLEDDPPSARPAAAEQPATIPRAGAVSVAPWRNHGRRGPGTSRMKRSIPQGKITKNFLGSMSYCESDVDFSDKAISIHRPVHSFVVPRAFVADEAVDTLAPFVSDCFTERL